MRKHLTQNFITKPFLLDDRSPGSVILDECIEYRDSLFKELGTHKGVKEAVDFHFYNNKPLPLALPIQTATKISTLFS